MSTTNYPRFGIWAPHYGPTVRPDLENTRTARFAFARDVVVSAENAGLDTVLFAQHTIASGGKHDNEVLEPWTACAAAAAVTKNIEIIAAIKPLLYHPVVLAKLALGIEDISNGRFAINFVNAFSRPELENSGIGFPEHDERYAYGREWLAVVKALMSGETVTHRGTHFNIQDYRLLPSRIHRLRPRIYSGGESEPARALAADLVDIMLIFGRPLAEIRQMIDDVASRPRQGGPIAFGTTGLVVARQTDAEAQDYLQHLRNTLTKPDPEAANPRYAFIDTKVVSNNRAKLGKDTSIGIGGSLLPGFIGSFDRVAERILEFYRGGVGTFILTFHPQIAEQELFAREVIPRVRAAIRANAA
jgi:alkanesulfonate monooxygenase